MTGTEWDRIERGLKQRLVALNLFLKDIYHEGRSLRDGIVPSTSSSAPRSTASRCGESTCRTTSTSPCAGLDIVRTRDGVAVLEDNLQVPSGVSYMLGCRDAVKGAFPDLYRAHRVREVSHYSEQLYAILASLAPSTRTPRVAILTPGLYNSAYYEHALLAGEMGVDLVEGTGPHGP